MSAYYSENDPLKAEVLREAIKAGAIAPGNVDERSIKDVKPSELMGYRQCHFFAGGGFWSVALRRAGWPDDEPVWTGSCPCPSFSCAGKGGGFDDPRHLWPDWAQLIRERRPAAIFGEQADDAVGYGWLDLVQTDLEAQAYAVGKIIFGAHSVGAPHIRQRLYFVADTEYTKRGAECSLNFKTYRGNGFRGSGELSDGANPDGGQPENGNVQRCGEQRLLAPNCGTGDGQHTLSPRLERHFGNVREWRGPGWLNPQQARSAAEAGATRGQWAGCDWWYGRDGKYRPIEPGLFPLAHGYSARVGVLRLAGDAIVVEQAAAFIRAYRQGRARR